MKLLYKELSLAAHPSLYAFMLLGCLVIIPVYPYTVIFMFGCLAPFITFMFARENNDAWYTATLPIQKKEIVLAKCLLLTVVQLGQLLISLPFAILRNTLTIENNPVGMDATAAWYGFGLIIFSIFNLVFLPAYYTSGYKAGVSFLSAMLPVILFMAAVEILVHFPIFYWMDSTSPEDLLRQLPILFLGLILYVVSMAASYRIAAHRFEKVNL